MIIRNIGVNGFTVICDMCGNRQHIDATKYDEASAIATRVGWVLALIAGAWGHYCPQCVAHYRKL
jgi:hypothetical protein